jgi:predicted small integral membrane protein
VNDKPYRRLRLAQRLTKSAIALSVGLFGLLAGSGNIVDFDSNWQFVQHVLAMNSMEPWFRSAAMQQRAITDPGLQRAFYLTIIAGELVFGLLAFLGGALMLRASVARNAAPMLAGKTCYTLGCLVAVLVWYLGFAVVGGEYFAMWANQWNGQMKSYAFAGFILLSLVYVSQPEQADPADDRG